MLRGTERGVFNWFEIIDKLFKTKKFKDFIHKNVATH